MHLWRAWLFATQGQLDAAETEVGLCWAAGRSGATRLVEFQGPLAEARLAAARGDTAAARERPADAARLLAAAETARPPLGYLAPGFTAARGAATAAARQARQILGEDRFTQAWHDGQHLTLDQAVAYATRRSGGRKRPATGWASLTPAEREVARLAGEGLRNDAIARRLFIAPGTVKVHLTHIFTKLGITTRTELAAQAAAHDLAARLSRAPDRPGDARDQLSGSQSTSPAGMAAPAQARCLRT